MVPFSLYPCACFCLALHACLACDVHMPPLILCSLPFRSLLHVLWWGSAIPGCRARPLMFFAVILCLILFAPASASVTLPCYFIPLAACLLSTHSGPATPFLPTLPTQHVPGWYLLFYSVLFLSSPVWWLLLLLTFALMSACFDRTDRMGFGMGKGADRTGGGGQTGRTGREDGRKDRRTGTEEEGTNGRGGVALFYQLPSGGTTCHTCMACVPFCFFCCRSPCSAHMNNYLFNLLVGMCLLRASLAVPLLQNISFVPATVLYPIAISSCHLPT